MERFQVKVTDMNWERIHLYFTIKINTKIPLSSEVKFFLINEKWEVESLLNVVNKIENKYIIELNIVNNGVNRCITNGTYKILAVDKAILGKEETKNNISGERYGIAVLEGSNKLLEEKGRCFRYLGTHGAYTVTFMLNEDEENVELLILCYNTNKKSLGHMIRGGKASETIKNRFFDKIKSNYRKQKKHYERKIKKLFYKCCVMVYRKMKKKYILFQSEQDDKLSLNMQALYKRMQERDLDKEYKIVFSLRKNTSERQTKISTFKMLRYMAIADIIIIDDHVPTYDWLLLDKKTKLIQIWHAGAGFKGVGYSRWGHLGCPGPFSCHRQYTYCIAGSKNIAHFFSEQFGIADEQVLPTGMPRMDQYLDVANREKITSKLLETYPKIKDNKVILFAPTYRGGNKATAYYPYQMIDFEALYEYCRAKHAIVFFKMHPWVSENVPIEDKYREYFFDLNTYSNINELFYITDLLITDYSSNMYEYALMGKPMLAFAYDKIQYATTRGFHRSYDDNVFGKVCETFEDLMKALWKEDYEFEKHKIYMKNHYEYTDCKNSDRVIDWVILDNMPEEYRKKLDAHIQKISEYRGKSYKYLIEELS